MSNIRWKDFRYEPLAQEYDVGICTSSMTCKRGISSSRHEHGYADNFGTVHWHGWHSSTRKRGLHRLLTLIAEIKLQHRRRPIPLWQALYEKEVWAQKEGLRRFRVRFPLSYSVASRRRALDYARRHTVPVRTLSSKVYQWMILGES